MGADSVSKADKNLADQLKSTEALVRRAAAEQIGKNEKASPTEIAALTQGLKDTDVIVRNHSAWALGKSGKSSPEALKALIAALNDAEWSVRHNAALSLTWFGSNAVPELAKHVNDGKDRAGIYAATVIARADKAKEKELLPRLAASLTSTDPEIRVLAANALAFAGDRALPYMNQIAGGLSDEVQDVQLSALAALGNMGPQAKQHSPGILAVLKDTKKKEIVRCVAAETLAKIDPRNEIVIKEMVGLLGEKKERLPEAIIGALGESGAAALPELISGLKKEDSEAKLLTIDAIARIGAPAKEAAPLLIPMLEHPDWQYRLRAAGALGRVGSGDKTAIGALKKAAQDKEESVRVQAVVSLKQLEGDSAARAN